MYKHNIFLLNIYMHVFLFIYTWYIYTAHTHILCKQKRLFWMWLIVLKALIYFQTLYDFMQMHVN